MEGNTIFYSRNLGGVTGPVSVAFGYGHLYVLGAANVYSFSLSNFQQDGVAALAIGDGSAAQVGVIQTRELVVTEKTGDIELFSLHSSGAVTGSATVVASGLSAPFGMATKGKNAFVTIAHANQIALVSGTSNGIVTQVPSASTSSGVQQNAPCWAAITGCYLFTANSPSLSVSRYAITGSNIFADAATAAQLAAAPTDVAIGQGILAVVNAPYVSIFSVDDDGVLTSIVNVTVGATVNGISVVQGFGNNF